MPNVGGGQGGLNPVKAVFHSIISPPLAKNFDIEFIFYIHASLKKFVLLVQSLKIFIFCLTFR